MARSRELKVGLFVALGLGMAAIVVFLIGDERKLFDRKVEYYARFPDVEGLKRGSPVRMGGIDVGTVTGVTYSADPADPSLRVTLSVARSDAVRIREGSAARIENKGFLGDKMVVVTLGDAGKPALPPGTLLPTETAGGLGDIMGRAGAIAEKADGVMGNLEKSTRVLAEDRFQKDVREAVSALNGVLGQIERGEGYAGKLLRDPDEAERLSRTVRSLEAATGELARTLRRVDAIVARVEQGPGFAHDLVYGDTGTRTVGQFGQVAEELALTLRGVREGDGLARAVLYGGKGGEGEVMGDVAAITRALRQIVAGLRAGRGTLGALLVDPSVYEDLKILLGNVERNKVLRALVRFSIQRDEKTPPVEVRDPEPPAQR